jgi:thiol-disulfide isomerase/thioredoxin
VWCSRLFVGAAGAIADSNAKTRAKETELKKLLAASLAALALACAPYAAAADLPSPQPFFSMTLNDMNDKPLALESLRGKPVVVNFWARWCGPCREEIPELVRAYEKDKAKGLTFVGVAVEENSAPVREFASAYKMNYLVVMGGDDVMGLMRDLGNTKGGLPFTVAIDRSGKMVGLKLGILQDGDLDGMVAALLGKK